MTSEDDKTRAAGTRNTERQLVGATTADIVKAAKANEINSTWRVYTKEWLPVWRDCMESGAQTMLAQKYEGRVKDEDWKITEDDEGMDWVLSLRLWNVKAEWKTKELADTHALELAATTGEEPEVVARNSRKEHVLANYGKLLLPKKKNDG